MNYQIAIPSYNRVLTLQQKTLALLEKYNIPKEQITIFVADEEQHSLYSHLPCKLVIGRKGIKDQRNFIFSYYEEGTHLVCMDDDVQEVQDEDGASVDISTLIEQGFQDAVKYNCRAWGLYPCANKMFMKNSKPLTVGWRFLIGNFFGLILDLEFKVSVELKTDYELSLWYAKKYGGVLRYNHYVAKTKMGARGGIGLKTTDRLAIYQTAIAHLKNTYSDHVRLNKRRDGEILIF